MRSTGVYLLICLAVLAACSPRGVGLDADSTESQIEMDVDGALLKGELIQGEHTDVSGVNRPALFFEYPCRPASDASTEAKIILDRLSKRLERQQATWFSVTCLEPAEQDGGRRVTITEFVHENGDWQARPTRQSNQW